MIIKYYNNLSINQLLKCIVILSIIIAGWVMYIQKGWVNDDSLLYFEAARLFSIGEWKSGVQIFQWPLYSLLIAGLHYVTTLDFQLCAQVLNAIFFAIATHSLLRIVVFAGGEKTTLLSIALLLFATSYITGSVLPMLIRDQGFWAFLLTALVFFIKFYRDQNIKDALYWQLFALIAFLFRIEAATYIVMLPITLLYAPNTNTSAKALNFFKAQSLNISLIVLVGLFTMMHNSLSINDLGRTQEVIFSLSQIQENFRQTISVKAQAMATSVLGEPLQDFAWMGVILILICIAGIKSMLVSGWLPALITTIYYKKAKKIMAHDVYHIITITALLAFTNAVLIIFKINILPSRYLIVFGFMLLIFASFALHSLFIEWKLKQTSKTNIIVLSIALVSISLGIISNCLPKSSSYTYEQDAVAYVKEQLSSNDKKIFYASYKARHYAREPYIGRWDNLWAYTQQAIADDSILQYNHLLINFISDDNPDEIEKILAEKLPHYVLVKRFYGYKNKKGILVYKKQ